jgi:hypothetical protein
MSFTPLFSVAQPVGMNSIVTVTDISTGSDSAITQRRVYLQKAGGTYLVPSGTTTSYVAWPIVDASINIDCMGRDYCLSITVQWLDVNNAVLYSKTILCLFTQYSKDFFYSLTQDQTANYVVTQDANYYTNKAMLWVEITSAINAVAQASDIASAQAALDRAAYMILNESKYF